MKKRFFFLLIVGVVAIVACQKEPPKGNYTGRFEGSYMTEYQKIVYTTDYSFEVTKSTDSEVRLKEKASQTTSILQKKANDSIVGRIGFGNIYNPSHDGSPAINTIAVSGKYYTENAKSCISGTFSTTILIFDTVSLQKKSYPSEGTFVLQSY